MVILVNENNTFVVSHTTCNFRNVFFTVIFTVGFMPIMKGPWVCRNGTQTMSTMQRPSEGRNGPLPSLLSKIIFGMILPPHPAMVGFYFPRFCLLV